MLKELQDNAIVHGALSLLNLDIAYDESKNQFLNIRINNFESSYTADSDDF